jgi:hypothetical protein
MTNNTNTVCLKDALDALCNEVIAPLELLSLILTTYSNEVNTFSADELAAFGHLLDALCVKAKTILREHLDETNEGGD